ncbi:site-specific DNA-methyltransferase [Burkholderia stagnalis]|uniref:site-specific DNA-methyltransferase n=1 Tax=Burkholderia stagnalis TaxID=1503054 RepID=UPI000F5FFE1A|nr:site-specific DNA-methyltransferase [Burkholderia stagnalis]RQY80067.1 site-specific DNA-methyltransferase [Burkholderia stagnalis]
MSKQKLELTWIGKDKRPKPEPRILLEDPSMSYHATHRVMDGDVFDNRLIFGDNLLALKALEQEFSGSIKCVFIDPPYNTGSAFTHYDDGLEHSIWLGLMRDRLEIIKRLLSEDGSLWITIDDNEAHYLKVLCDEIFGRQNFVASVIWEKSDSPKMDSRYFSSRHDYILVYAKSIDFLKLARLPDDSDEATKHYNKIDADGRRYYTKPLRAMGSGDDTREARPTLFFPITAPDGTAVLPKRQDGVDGRWRWSQDRVQRDADKLEWVKSKNGWNPYYKIFAEEGKQRPPETIWTHREVGSNRTSKAEVKALIDQLSQFDTPKPEALLKRILDLATNPGDLVLDSFAGSGTTGAVAHKMGRRWIMVELGEHCHTHIIPRLKKVIDGENPGGITQAVDWQGGGGFRYYRLAPSLIVNDRWGNSVINPEYNAAMLAEALAKLEGFTYAPSETHWWHHGHSSERDFIYVTTQNLSAEQLQALSDEVGAEQTLLVCCSAFRGVTAAKAAERWPNLTLKKIPKMVLARCEWGQDDYSLNVANLPMAEIEQARPTAIADGVKKTRNKKAAQASAGQSGLFEENE